MRKLTEMLRLRGTEGKGRKRRSGPGLLGPRRWGLRWHPCPVLRHAARAGLLLLLASALPLALKAQEPVPISNGSVSIPAWDGYTSYLVTLNQSVTAFSINSVNAPKHITVLLVQDATGGRTVSGWASNIAGSGAISVSTTANATTSVAFAYDPSTNIWAATGGGGGGGGGSPGGASGTLQYNNAGGFGGISGWTTDGVNTLTGPGGSTITGSVGDLNFNASGTNQNVTLTPSGSGVVLVQPPSPSTQGAVFQLNGNAGTVQVISPSANASLSLIPKGTGFVSIGTNGSAGLLSKSYSTGTNCASSASPAVCGSAAAGRFVIAASATSVVVNTTAVSASSEIMVTEDQSLGTALSVTCNTGITQPVVTARTSGTSFTVSISAGLATNPVCFSYTITN